MLFHFQGVDKEGKKITGQLDALNVGEVRMQLRSQGIRPTRLSMGGAGLNTDLGELLKGPSGSRLTLEQLLSFTRQTQVLISSGIPIVQGLEILEEQAIDRGVKRLLASLREKVSSGAFLWEAMSLYPKAFPRMYIALVRAGESSGSIDQMLGRLGRYLESVEKIRRMVKSAMMYPVIVVSIGMGVITIMMVFVIPKFEKMLSNSGQDMPMPTQIVINISHFMVNHFLAIIGTTVTVVFLLIKFKQSPEGKAIIDRIAFRAPLFGLLAQRGATARFARTLATLLASGVNLLDAIDICRATIDNAVLEVAVGKIRSEIETGKTLGVVMGRLNVFPRMAVQMVSVGEATGSLDKMLEKVAEFYEEEVEMTVAGLSKLIEPIILVFLGGTVGGLMIAMYLPIFKAAGSAG